MSAHNDVTKPNSASWRLQISSEHRLRSENLAFDIVIFDQDVWYPKLEQFTFKTVFLPFKRREAIAIIHYYQTRYIKNSPNSKPLLTTYDIAILNNLEQEIDKILKNKQYSFNENGAFMRLCGRSPKDGEPLNRDKNVRNVYNENLGKLLKDSKYPNNGNTKLIAIAHTQWLKVETAKEAMNILLSSERVYTDLHDWIRYGEPEQIVFRVFDQALSLDYEFRAFVYDNKLTAISQYDHYAIYPYLKKEKEKIQKLIVSKWKQVHEHILQDHYCIDFGYFPDRNEVILIEISPFRTCTGAACFNWKLDHDTLYGIDDFEFRLNEKLHPQIDDLVEANWELRWWAKEDPEPYWTLYDKIMQNDKQSKKEKIQKAKYIQGMIFGVEIGIVAAIWSKSRFWGAMSFLGLTMLSSYYGYFVANNDGDEKSNEICDGDLNNLDDAKFGHKYLEYDQSGGHLAEIKQINEKINNQRFYLFVYGTLKRNFHWNHKFLSRSGSEFLGCAKTMNKYALVMGDCNVPYVLDLDDQKTEIGHNILGELWQIDYETLIGLDDYEGVNKGHYKRKKIDVVLTSNEEEAIKANIYMKADCQNIDLSKATFLEEYEFAYHQKYYSPIQHIQVKQLKYLGEEYKS